MSCTLLLVNFFRETAGIYLKQASNSFPNFFDLVTTLIHLHLLLLIFQSPYICHWKEFTTFLLRSELDFPNTLSHSMFISILDTQIYHMSFSVRCTSIYVYFINVTLQLK